MRKVRVFSIGLIVSWLCAQIIYVPFIKYFISTSQYAFLTGWDNGVNVSPITSIYMVISIWFLSMCIGFFISAFLYSPVELKFYQLFKNKFTS